MSTRWQGVCDDCGWTGRPRPAEDDADRDIARHHCPATPVEIALQLVDHALGLKLALEFHQDPAAELEACYAALAQLARLDPPIKLVLEYDRGRAMALAIDDLTDDIDGSLRLNGTMTGAR